MTRRVVIIGAESTGKSTLAQTLAQRTGLPLTGEYARSYAATLDRPLGASDVEPIARGQLAEEDRFDDAPRVLHDTNLLSTLIYARHYYSLVPAWLDDALAQRHYALYLFCQPDIPWVADPGQRESAAARDTLHRIFEAELHQRGVPVVRVAGDGPQRIATAVGALKTLG